VGAVRRLAVEPALPAPRAGQFQNLETTDAQRIGICPRTAAVGGCDSEGDYSSLLDPLDGWTTDMAAGAVDYSCDGVGGTYTLAVTIERWYKTAPGQPTPPAPTAIPTPTQTPAPTPTP
jgi:hypothetical protein